jgi:hypothetical protein
VSIPASQRSEVEELGPRSHLELDASPDVAFEHHDSIAQHPMHEVGRGVIEDHHVDCAAQLLLELERKVEAQTCELGLWLRPEEQGQINIAILARCATGDAAENVRSNELGRVGLQRLTCQRDDGGGLHRSSIAWVAAYWTVRPTLSDSMLEGQSHHRPSYEQRGETLGSFLLMHNRQSSRSFA